MLGLLLAATSALAADPAPVPAAEAGDGRLIKVLERKEFMKIGRAEIGPHAGAVTNDPFLRRNFFGASVAYHLTEVFAIEVQADLSPDFGTGDWKPVTWQLVNENRVSPDLSKMIHWESVSFAFAPLYGKVALGDRILRFDLFGTAGTGLVFTVDEEFLLPRDAPVESIAQWHPTTNFGGGVRVIFDDVALRMDARSIVYIENVGGTTLEMKNNFALTGGVSFFLPDRG